ncbi:hypothetical protein E2562_025060 [Oryza meyeriana var. granulata]|uniref:RRM domain-containing protein n=1 Tax=Oryza meyeriana var. granulata TaxID=110450 RepID=A0A6G1D7I2_9ORYZ|nr:hypothetical protein E2562_025060 [Oryza meyeriana var. granulata]
MVEWRLALRHKIKKLEPLYANDIVQYTNIAKPSWQIRWYALSALDEEIQLLIDEAKSSMGPLHTQQLLQSPSLQSPPACYESPSPYLRPQFQSLNTPSDGMPRDSLDAQVKVLGSGVPEMHNQRQSHPLGSQRDFLAHSLKDHPELKIYITFKEFSYASSITEENVRDYFKKFGPVINVYIPYKPEKHIFGSVTFQNAETVRLLLSRETSHFICGEEARIKPYLGRAEREQRKLAQKNDHFGNVAHRTSCANAIEGQSGEKLPSYNELSQELLKLRVSEKSGISNAIAPEIDSPLTYNLSEKETESPQGDHATKEFNVGESSELPAM